MNNVFVPNTAAEATAWVADRYAARAGFAVRGACTRSAPVQGVVLETSAMRDTRFFHPDDMVIGVEAGLPFESVAGLLAEHAMVLPVNPWFRGASVGGMAAANDFGPNRLFGGGLRDAIIGVEYINGRGQLVKAGGKVVKNVSGYDLGRMMLGSLGGLGVITALNFKVIPAPLEPHGLFWRGQGLGWRAGLAEGALHRKLPLDWLQVIAEKGEWRLGMGISGNAPRRDRLQREWQGVFDGRLELAGDGAEPSGFAHLSAAGRFRGFLSPFRESLSSKHAHLHGMAPTRAFLGEETLMSALVETLEREGAILVLHPLGGDFHLFLEDASDTARLAHGLAKLLAPRSGFLVVERVPDEVSIPQWVQPFPPAFEWMCRLKRGLDPHGIFRAPFYEMKNHETDASRLGT